MGNIILNGNHKIFLPKGLSVSEISSSDNANVTTSSDGTLQVGVKTSWNTDGNTTTSGDVIGSNNAGTTIIANGNPALTLGSGAPDMVQFHGFNVGPGVNDRVLGINYSGELTISPYQYYNLYSITSTPILDLFSGAGSGGGYTISGTNDAGLIIINTGSTPTATAQICEITFSGGWGYPTACAPILQPADITTADLVGQQSIFVEGLASGFKIFSNSISLDPATTYSWYYNIKGW